MSWNDGVAYTRWLSRKTGQAYRLPTEAEWEYACRGGTQTTYWWGDEFDPTMLNSSVTWRQGDAPWPRDEHTLITRVDQYPANPFGLHDILGNNWEWVQDYASPTNTPRKFAAGVPRGGPQGPASGHERVLRGGGWNGTAARTDLLLPLPRRSAGVPQRPCEPPGRQEPLTTRLHSCKSRLARGSAAPIGLNSLWWNPGERRERRGARLTSA